MRFGLLWHCPKTLLPGRLLRWSPSLDELVTRSASSTMSHSLEWVRFNAEGSLASQRN